MPLSKLTTWAIVADGDTFAARELTLDELNGASFVIAHPDKLSAERGVARMRMMQVEIAERLEKSRDLEVKFRRMVDVEVEMQRRLIGAVHEIGRPDRPGTPPGY